MGSGDSGAVGVAGNVTAVLVSRLVGRQERLRREEERREVERAKRRDTYQQFAWMLARLHKYASMGYPPSAEDWKDWLDYYAYWSSAVVIVGGVGAVRAVGALTDLLDALGPEMADAAVDGSWRSAFMSHEDEVERAREAVLGAMREDLGALTFLEAIAERALEYGSSTTPHPLDFADGTEPPRQAPPPRRPR